MSQFLPKCFALVLYFLAPLCAEDSLKPYSKESEVPQTPSDLWASFDPRKDALETKVIQSWNENGVVCQYVTFTVGTFKGVKSRIAAYYAYPKGSQKNSAFVYSHGGGQRAERSRANFWASRGFATVDINWNGREMEPGISENTNWGKIDPSQGPQFYPKALRKNFKTDCAPDEHTIDSVGSPRNSNWFLLALTARRAITFLERQKEVDPHRIGFTGFSMGGTITSMTAFDARLKAVAPMVGGSGFRGDPLFGLPDTNKAHQYKIPGMFDRTLDSRSTWGMVKVPTLFVNSSNDFHAPTERMFKAMNLLPHDQWWVTHNIHANHGPMHNQYMMLNLFFDKFLKGKDLHLPKTVASKLKIKASQSAATFEVRPDQPDKIKSVKVYYSHDPNARGRFWAFAKSKVIEGVYSAELPFEGNLPLYAIANITYEMDSEDVSFRGATRTFSISSDQSVYEPKTFDATAFYIPSNENGIFEDFSQGWENWALTANQDRTTFKFQDPKSCKGDDYKLVFTIDNPKGKKQLRLGAKSQHLGIRNMNRGRHFSLAKMIPEGVGQKVKVALSDFKSRTKGEVLSWNCISQFNLSVFDLDKKAKMLPDANGKGWAIRSIQWVK